MDELLETVNLAVAKMQQRKQERDALQRKHAELLDTLSRLDMEEKKRQEELKIRLRRMVYCIHATDSKFQVKEDELLLRQKEIEFRMQSIQTGMGTMHLFVKTSRGKPITLWIDPRDKKIHFPPEKPYDNPFSHVYDETDDIKTPGEKNFKLYAKNLLADIEKYENYGAMAYGPSGTGKTTMIQHIIEYLCQQLEITSVEVFQIYVRQNIPMNMHKDIPKTDGAVVSQALDGGIRHEKFNLCTVDPEKDVVKVFLNDVQMLHSIGKEMYKHGRTLYRIFMMMVETTYPRTAINHLSSYCSSTPMGFNVRIENIFELFKKQTFFKLEGFNETIQNKWIKPIQDIVDLFNKSRSLLITMVRERFEKEKDFFLNPNPSEEDLTYFANSGGFIPLHWLSYMDPTYHEELYFFEKLEENLIQPNIWYESLYLDQGSSLDLSDVEQKYYDRFFLFTSPEPAQLYFHFFQGNDKELSKLPRITDHQNRGYIFYDPEETSQLSQYTQLSIKEYNQEKYRASALFKRISKERRAQWLKYKTKMETIKERMVQSKTMIPETQPFELNQKEPLVVDPKSKFMNAVQKFSFQRSTPQNQQSSRCATVYRLRLPNAKTVTFIDLPGNEDQIMGCEAEKDDNVLCTETLGIRSLLRYVRELMMIKRLNVAPTDIGIRYPSTIYEEVFAPLMEPTCKAGFLCFVANYGASPNYTKNTTTTLNYMTGLAAAKFSCEKNENEKFAVELLEEYEHKRQLDEAKLKEKFPPKEERPRVEGVSVIDDETDVTQFAIPTSEMLPGDNFIKRPYRARCTIGYSVDDDKHRIELPEYFFYKCTFEGNFEFNNKKNLLRFTDVSEITFSMNEIRDIRTGKKIRDYDKIPTKPRYFEKVRQLVKNEWSDVITEEKYEIEIEHDFAKSNGAERHVLVDSKGNQRDLERFELLLPLDQPDGILPFSPPLINIRIRVYKGKTEVIITPKNNKGFEDLHKNKELDIDIESVGVVLEA